MRVVRELKNIIRCREFIQVFGELPERTAAYRLERGAVPGSWKSLGTWFLDIDTFQRGITRAAETGFIQPARSPHERLAAEGDEQGEAA